MLQHTGYEAPGGGDGPFPPLPEPFLSEELDFFQRLVTVRKMWQSGALTCVQREVSGQGLLSAKHFPTHVAGEKLVIEFPGWQSVSRLQDYLFCFWPREQRIVRRDRAAGRHFVLVNAEGYGRGLLPKDAVGDCKQDSQLVLTLISCL